MSTVLQSVRGMNDILPSETPYWQHLEKQVREILTSYGYSEIRFPILEQTALFKRTIGEVTDIVEKEMYTFEDRNGDSLSMRPEGTACCVRAGIEHGLLYNQIQRLWYMGPFFRHERPQRGRYRQFFQLGIETFGLPEAEADAEIILISKKIIETLGLLEHFQLEINTLGTAEIRARYRDTLVAYFKKFPEMLDEDSQRRLHTNPLRILDSKNPEMKMLIAGAPKMLDVLDEPSIAHFEKLKSILDRLKVPYTVNPTLVRGLDYYCHTVFEWTTDLLGSQSTVFAGGRYDGLVEQLGGKPTPAVGFAMGMERLLELAAAAGKRPEINTSPDIFFMSSTAGATEAIALAETLRETCPGLSVITHHSDQNMGKQLKKADNSGARFALILGDTELLAKEVLLKPLRTDAAQERISWKDLPEVMKKLVLRA